MDEFKTVADGFEKAYKLKNPFKIEDRIAANEHEFWSIVEFPQC
jgi:hypothetical protein